MANMGIFRGDRCLDNTPVESFWEHYKDETSYGESFNTFEALKASIDQYIYFYNHKRYQEKIDSLIPASSCLRSFV